MKNLKAGLTRDQHFAPGTILNVEVDTTYPLGFGMATEDVRVLQQQPVLQSGRGVPRRRRRLVARYPNAGLVASGWLKGEELMSGRAAVVSVEMNPGRVVLFGLRPQHRAQTHATFPLLFNALYLAAEKKGTVAVSTSPTGQ